MTYGKSSFLIKTKRIFGLLIVLSCLAAWAPAKAGTLRVGLLRQPESLNFFGATDTWSKKILQFFHMPLYVHDPRDGSMLPWLAEAMPEVDEPSFKVTVRLRDACWDDGSKVTAEDLIFTVSVIQEFNVPGHMEKWKNVARMEAIDSRTIRFTLKGPPVVFLNRTLYTGFVQKKSWKHFVDSVRRAKNPLKSLVRHKVQKVASNGPFFMASCCQPLFIVLKRNLHFFAKDRKLGGITVGPHLDSIVFNIYRNVTEALIALERDNVDFIWWDIPQEHLDKLRGDRSVRLYRTPRRGFDYLAFNLQRSPFNDPSFRTAVATLIDREQIVKKALKGDAIPAYSVIPPHNTFWYNAGVRRAGKGLSCQERLREAKALLKGAGYSWSKGALVLPTGRKMRPVEILTNSAGSKPCRLKAALLIKRWLSEIGVSVIPKMRPLHDVLSLLRENIFDMYILGWGHLSDDPGYLETFFHSSEARPAGKNYPRFRNARFDELADRASGEMDLFKRKALVFEMQELITKELPYIPLYTRNRVEAVKKNAFQGWIELPGGIGNLWSFLNVRPAT